MSRSYYVGTPFQVSRPDLPRRISFSLLSLPEELEEFLYIFQGRMSFSLLSLSEEFFEKRFEQRNTGDVTSARE